ncbi:hypothetical protein PAXRUDRAFT_171149, partial [Paxillus rubicundulus Ve08.2h10]
HNWLAGLHYWHIINNTTWNSKDMLHHICHGFAKMVPSTSQWAKCPPIMIKALYVLFDHLNPSNHLDCAISAITLIAFWCCFRLGKLLIPSTNTFDHTKHVSCSVLHIPIETLANDYHYSSFHIPWTKTTKEMGADISITE